MARSTTDQQEEERRDSILVVEENQRIYQSLSQARNDDQIIQVLQQYSGQFLTFWRSFEKEHEDLWTRVEQGSKALDRANEAVDQANKEINVLQEQMRTHREASAATQQTSSSALERRSEKLPDAPVFDHGEATEFYSWLRRIKLKLSVNADRYPTPESRIGYVVSRLSGAAARHVEPYLDREGSTVEDVYSTLDQRFGDPFRKQTARDKYRQLRQGHKEFAVFIAEFYEYSMQAEIPMGDQIYDLRDKLSFELKQEVLRYRPNTLADFVNEIQFANRNLTQLNKDKARFKKPSLTSSNPFLPPSKTTSEPKALVELPTPTSTPGRASPQSNNPFRAPLAERTCYNCGQKGHIAFQCKAPRKNQISLAAVELPEKDSGKEQGPEKS